MRRGSVPLIGLALITAAFALGACGGDDSAEMTLAGDDAGYQEEEYATTTVALAETAEAPAGDLGAFEEPASDGGEADTNAQTAPAPLDPATLGRQIIYTANLELEVDDVIAAGEQVQLALSGLGGVLFGQETTTGDNPRSILTIKVPPENFQEALSRLGGIGKLLSQQVFADDVTDRVVDLQSRITTAEASVERLRSFLETAEGVEAVAELEAQLLQRETDLELLRGQLRTLENQVSLATIVLVLREPVPPTPEPLLELVQTAYAGHDDGAGCPGGDSLRVTEGDAVTVCYELANAGDTNLANIELRDQGLRIDEDEFVVVEGDLAAALQPEARIILMAEVEANPGRYPDPDIEVDAVDADGEKLRIQVGIEYEQLGLRVDEDDSLPGFTDAIETAWEGLQRFFGVIVVAAGLVIPFLWVPVLLAGAYWWWRRRRVRPEASAPAPESGPEAGEAEAEEAPGETPTEE
jgi:hypothetical protein